ncbi:MAG: hypothetical protein J6Y28_06785 [Acholeplasmatales bacterium]|nr:hypothetical protein [Acholeplasmatales bacterium]
MKTIKLLKVFLKNFEMIAFEKKKSKVFYMVMAIVTMLIIFIPTAFMIGIISYGMTVSLVENNHLNEGINFLLYAISIFSFVFSINVIFNVFYFSSDIERILPMPFKEHQIIGAKFFNTLINENFIELILILSSLIGFYIGGKLDIYALFIILIALVSLPVLPLVYCSIICMVFMFLTRKITNKDLVSKFSSLLLILAVVGILLMAIFLTNFDLEDFTLNLVNSNFMEVCKYIFPNVYFLTDSMSNPISIVFYLLITLGSIGIFYLFAKLLYFRGLNQSNYKKDKKKEIVYKKSSKNVSYLKKEFKLLFKTPAFFSNCVIINFIWPFLIALVAFIYDRTGNLKKILDLYYDNNYTVHLSFIIGIIILSILITAVNSISSSSISREGSSFFYMKLVPISYKSQIIIKAFCSIIVSYIGLFLYILVFSIIFNLGILNTILYLVLSLISVVFISFLGVYLDTVNPKLVWDDEINALRGNHNVFINMAFAILISGVLVGLIFMLKFLNLGLVIAYLLSFVIIIAATVLIYFISMKYGSKNIERIE